MKDINSDRRTIWTDKRYHSLDFELQQLYGQKVYKLSLHGGMSCPNRDGTLDTRGCIFCSEGGSGDFSTPSALSVTAQIEEAKKKVLAKVIRKEEIKYIAYFQAYTNTHASIPYLRKLFMEAIGHPDIIILSIATRPDCLGDDVLALLEELNQIKPVWVELGLQTIHERTAVLIRRGYPLSTFEYAVDKLQSLGIPIIVHTILGLPKETKNDMLMTMEYIAKLPIKGVKLQLLHILKGTELGNQYEQGLYTNFLSLQEYLSLVISCLELLPKEVIIHRITGDGPKKLLLAPLWSGNKKLVLNSIHKQMKELDTWQGKYHSSV